MSTQAKALSPRQRLWMLCFASICSCLLPALIIFLAGSAWPYATMYLLVGWVAFAVWCCLGDPPHWVRFSTFRDGQPTTRRETILHLLCFGNYFSVAWWYLLIWERLAERVSR